MPYILIKSLIKHVQMYPIFKKLVKDQKLIGLDIEYDSNTEEIILIQFGFAKIAFIYEIELPKELLDIICSSGYTKVGVGISKDIQLLHKKYNLEQCHGIVDLNNIAKLQGYKKQNLKYLYNYLFNKNILEHNFIFKSGKTITKKQYNYAALDACMSYLVGCKLLNIEINNIQINNIIVVVDPIVLLNEYSQKYCQNVPKYTFNTYDNYNNQFSCMINFDNLTSIGYGLNKKSSKMDAAQKIIDQIDS